MKGKKFWARMTSLFLSVLMVMGIVAGCGSDNAGNGTAKNGAAQTTAKGDENSNAETEPVMIRWARSDAEQDPEKDRVLLEFQKRTNTKIEFVTTPWDQYTDKLNIMMATGEQLDVVNCDPDKNMLGWARDGLILAYDEYIKDGRYPHVSSVLNSDIFSDMKIDGKSYFKPLPLCSMVQGLMIRQDWLDNLGMKAPANLDELYTVIKAFKEQDPDKNGKEDTVGLYAGGDYFDFSMTAVMMAFAVGGGNNAYNNWLELKDGTLTRWEVSDNYRQALEFCRKLIKEGLLNKDWASVKYGDSTYIDEFAKGKMGICIVSQPDMVIQKAKVLNSDARFAYMAPVQGIDGVPANLGHSGGYWNGNVIPKTCKNPGKVLEMMEYSMTEEGRELTLFGIRDIHIKEVKQETGRRLYVLNKEECDKDWDTAKNGYNYPLSWGALNYFENAYIPMKEYNFDYDEAIQHVETWVMEESAKDSVFSDWANTNAKYAAANPMINVLDERIMPDSNLISIYTENELKCLVAKDSEFEKVFNESKEKWLNAGGADLIRNGNEIYGQRKGK